MRSTKRELKALRAALAEAAGSESAATAALVSARNALGDSVTLSEYADGEWSASWFEGKGPGNVSWRKIRVTPAEIVTGAVAGLVRDKRRN